MPNKQIASAAKRASAQRSLANGHDEVASITDFSDDGEKEIDSVEYLLVLQQIRQEVQKASQGNFKRQFAMFSSDFRGHANAMVEEMNAYIDKLEMDALDTRDATCISTQAVVNATQEWNAQRSKVNEARVVDFSGIQREEEVNKVSQLIEATGKKRSRAQRQVLRKVKTDIEGLRKQEKIVTDARALVKRYKKLVRE